MARRPTEPQQLTKLKKRSHVPPDMAEFPERLHLAVARAARVLGMSQRALAERCGVPNGGLSSWLGGNCWEGITASSIVLLSRGLGVRVEWLLTGTGEMVAPEEKS